MRRLSLLFVCGVAIPAMAAAAVVGSKGSAPYDQEASGFGSFIRVLGHPPGHYVLLNTVTGRVMVVPDGQGPASSPPAARPSDGTRAGTATGATRAADSSGSDAPHEGMPEHGFVKGWDTWLAGLRRSIYYPQVQPSSGPGQITTMIGGLCDGMPGPQVSVDPGNVVADNAGRIFWVDLGWTAHLSGASYIRTLGTDGNVRTLGSVDGPLEGRVTRDLAVAEGLVRLVPDQQGGVYYTFSGGNTSGGSERQNSPVDAGDDIPQWTVIAHLRADGTHEFVSGIRGRVQSLFDNP